MQMTNILENIIKNKFLKTLDANCNAQSKLGGILDFIKTTPKELSETPIKGNLGFHKLWKFSVVSTEIRYTDYIRYYDKSIKS